MANASSRKNTKKKVPVGRPKPPKKALVKSSKKGELTKSASGKGQKSNSGKAIETKRARPSAKAATSTSKNSSSVRSKKETNIKTRRKKGIESIETPVRPVHAELISDSEISKHSKTISPRINSIQLTPRNLEQEDPPGDEADPFGERPFDSELEFEFEETDNETKNVSKKKSKGLAQSTGTALVSADPVTAYLAEIRRYPLLSKEEEHQLAIKYRDTGDPRAAEQLVTSNLRFVVKVAAEYSRFGAKLIDLIQEGNVGLMHAVKEFNPYKGVRLITYAVWWIRGYIQEYLMRQYSMVRIGTTQNQRKLFYRLQKERDALGAIGLEPSVALLAGRLGVSEEEVESMSKRMSGRDVSLNQPLDDSMTTSSSLLDMKASEEPSIDEQIGRAEELEALLSNIEMIRPSLNEKELYILENRLLSDDPLTLQEIGNHYGTTREAVRQLEARLMNKLRLAVTSSLASKDESSNE